jgi:phosphatidylethanolamine/phosphatidyl-N-methylethanolamine N-methyltransferase
LHAFAVIISWAVGKESFAPQEPEASWIPLEKLRGELSIGQIMIKTIATCKDSLARATRGIRSFKTFAFAAASDFQNVASIAPSSRHLARAMLEGLPVDSVRTVAELGAGTGAITRVLLERLPRHATLLAFEINPEFINCMKESFSDPRLVLLNTSAENLGRELRRRGYDRVDAVVSSLSLRFMPDDRQRILLETIDAFMDERSVYMQYQYLYGLRFENGRAYRHSSLPFLSQYFDSIRCRTIWRNLPPARVFTCLRKAPQGHRLPARARRNPRKQGSLASERS